MTKNDDSERASGRVAIPLGQTADAWFGDALQLPVLVTQAPKPGAAVQILQANAAFCTLSGYDLAELVGSRPSILHGADTDLEAARGFRVDLDRAGSGFAVLMYYRRDGTPFEVFLLGSRLPKGTDSTVRYALIGFWLTDPTYALPEQG